MSKYLNQRFFPSTNETYLNSQLFNKSKMLTLLSQYVKIFSKSKYDVGIIIMKSQRIHLTFELPISFRFYRTSPKKEAEIKEQIKNLLQTGLIKEIFSTFSAPMILVFKREEGKKTLFCVEFCN